jgi:hypothetical protein
MTTAEHDSAVRLTVALGRWTAERRGLGCGPQVVKDLVVHLELNDLARIELGYAGAHLLEQRS